MGSRFRRRWEGNIVDGMWDMFFRFLTLACILIHLGAGSPGVCTLHRIMAYMCNILLQTRFC